MSNVSSSAWKDETLGGVAEFTNGLPFRDKDFAKSGRKIIRIQQLNNPFGSYDFFGGDAPKSVTIENGDLIFSWSGTLKTLRWKHGAGVLNQHLYKVVPRKDVDPDFLYHLLSSAIPRLEAASHGSTMKHITKGNLNDHAVILPPLPEQKKIAEILSSVDDLIERTERLIAKLKELKKAMLQELLTKGIGHTTFKDSPVGRIPKEWEVLPMSELIGGLQSGVSVNSEDRNATSQEFGVLKVGCVYRGAFIPTEHKAIKASDIGRAMTKPLAGRIIMTRANTAELVGECAYLENDWPRLFLSDKHWLIEPKADRAEGRWLSGIIQSDFFRRLLIRAATGTSSSMKNVSQSAVMQMEVPVPSIDEQSRLAETWAAVEGAVERRNRLLVSVMAIKQALMQDLLTGRVRVKV